MQFRNPYMSNRAKMNLLEQWILVQSVLYYKTDKQLVDDFTYDNNGKQLLKMMNKYPHAFENTTFYSVFKDFEGSTGFYLYDKLRGENKRKIDTAVRMCMRFL